MDGSFSLKSRRPPTSKGTAYAKGCTAPISLCFSRCSCAKRSQRSWPGFPTPETMLSPHANLTLRNVLTGVSWTAQADGSGDYVFSDVSPGEYVVKASTDGMAAATRSGTGKDRRGCPANRYCPLPGLGSADA